MALLNVVAHGSPLTSAAGNKNPATLLVSVTDTSGNGITGLGSTNFTLDTMVVGPGGAAVVVNSITVGAYAGYYRINVVPTGAFNWAKGEYGVAVIVTSGTNKGQTLTNFWVP